LGVGGIITGAGLLIGVAGGAVALAGAAIPGGIVVGVGAGITGLAACGGGVYYLVRACID
jgi:hypothetical protein